MPIKVNIVSGNNSPRLNGDIFYSSQNNNSPDITTISGLGSGDKWCIGS